MKASVIVALLLAAAPSFASAQTVPASAAPSSASATATEMSAGLTMMGQMLESQEQARTSMLAALTPAHRALLAKIVGQLAIAAVPNFDAAAAQLDAALWPAEVQAIGQVEGLKRAVAASDAGQLQTTLHGTLSPDELKHFQEDAAQVVRTTPAGNRMQSEIAKMVRAASDPGHVLLQTVLFGVQPFTKMFERPIPASGGR